MFAPDPLGEVVSQLERQRAWRLSGAWPRWHPCAAPLAGAASEGYGVLDASVFARSDHARSLRRADAPVASDELLTLGEGERAIVLVRADHGWHRSGVVLQQGACYRVGYVGGTWQDNEAAPCGPAGQSAGRFELRRWLGRGRRYVDGQWMELIAHVAHPRAWAPRELPAAQLLRYLLVRDPEELTRTLIPLGRHLGTPASHVEIEMQAPSGLLYCYANDWWMFYDNNSGSVTLSIERLPDRGERSSTPRYLVTADGGVTPV